MNKILDSEVHRKARERVRLISSNVGRSRTAGGEFHECVKILIVVSILRQALKNWVSKIKFVLCFWRSWRVRKVPEAGRTNFLQISSKSDLMVPSCG